MDELSLGTCCNCGTENDVNNLMALKFLAPVPGTGWGCVLCNMPANGAVAVLCDHCLELLPDGKHGILSVCVGYPGENKRLPIEQLDKTRFDHDMRYHPKGGDY